MSRTHKLILITMLLLFCSIAFTFNLGSVLAQSTAPDITSFTTTAANVSRAALDNRTARVPVSWTTANRPLLSNLVFEQVLPDGTELNVELPRSFPWVNSNGDGIAAPILPTASVSEIRLKVTLFNLINGQTYDEAFLTLPIVDSGGNGPGTGGKPALTIFTTTTTSVLKADLEAGTARIPVAWTTIHRPITATLVFEQLMPSGEAVNVELPRDTPWVNSNDKGMVAPKAAGVQHGEILLRVRLLDVLWGTLYDVRMLVVSVKESTNPTIKFFTTSATGVKEAGLKDRSTLLEVSWAVDNRPDNSNLVFEQIMPDGTTPNVELPRDFVIVPSSGSGIVRPYYPGTGQDRIRIQMRLVNLTGSTTITKAEFTVPITDRVVPGPGGFTVVSGDACYSDNFPPSNGLAVNVNGRVESHSNGSGAAVYGTSDFGDYLGEMKPGETFTVLEGPLCRYATDNPLHTQRIWKIRSTLEGWALEYSKFDELPAVIMLTKADTPQQDVVKINSFTISTETADFDQDVTISWDISNAERFFVSLPNGSTIDHTNHQPVSSITLKAGELAGGTNPAYIALYAYDAQQNADNRDLSLTINSSIGIKSFTVSPENPASNGSVTLVWELEGTAQGRISWNQVAWQVPVTLIDITSATGSHTVPLLDDFRAYTFVLTITDANGVPTSREVTIQTTCAYTFFISDPANQDGRCPDSNPQSQTASFQQFERGFMVWRQAPTGNAITVFFNNGTLMEQSDTWGGQTYETGTPPDGLIAPANGFGWLWSQNQTVRDGLGWATGNEQGYTATIQSVETNCGKWLVATPTYLTLADGRTLRYAMSCATPGWTFMN